jgi:hypothetical protein
MDNSMHRLSVADAATQLGITSDAVRQRIRRGSIPHERDQDGKVYVYIHPNETRQDDRQDAYRDELVAELRNRIEFQERELERKDAIIMSLTQRIPELEPASEPREGPSEAHHGAGQGDGTPSPEKATQRPWWQRLFGG